MTNPSQLEKNTYIRNMCVFLRNPNLINKTTVTSCFNAFSYKIASIIFNNIQTGSNPLFSSDEFTQQVLKQVQKSVELVLKREVNQIAEEDFGAESVMGGAEVETENTGKVEAAKIHLDKLKKWAHRKRGKKP